jgi:hypothetical protein
VHRVLFCVERGFYALQIKRLLPSVAAAYSFLGAAPAPVKPTPDCITPLQSADLSDIETLKS